MEKLIALEITENRALDTITQGSDFPPSYKKKLNEKLTEDIIKQREDRRNNCSICRGEGGKLKQTEIDGKSYTYWKDCECIKGT